VIDFANDLLLCRCPEPKAELAGYKVDDPGALVSAVLLLSLPFSHPLLSELTFFL
jgi:hypothetical protein